MNPLIENLLRKTGFMYDRSAFGAMELLFFRATQVQKEEFINSAKLMPYKEFQKTVYWGIVRGRVFQRNGSVGCVHCRAWKRLMVHHQSYEHHGIEHEFLNELEVTCGACHLDTHCEEDLRLSRVGPALAAAINQYLGRSLAPKDINPDLDRRVILEVLEDRREKAKKRREFARRIRMSA